jgi:hypothetical protein
VNVIKALVGDDAAIIAKLMLPCMLSSIYMLTVMLLLSFGALK